MYIQVIDPNDNVLGENSLIRFEEKELYYSLVSEFNYNNDDLEICEFIGLEGRKNFEKGRYFINIFYDGHNVGNSEFFMR